MTHRKTPLEIASKSPKNRAWRTGHQKWRFGFSRDIGSMGFLRLSLKIAPLEVSVRRLFPQSPEMDAGRRIPALKPSGFTGHGFWVAGRTGLSSRVAGLGYGSSWFGSWVPSELLSSPEIDFWPPGIESPSSPSSGSTVADPLIGSSHGSLHLCVSLSQSRSTLSQLG
jgi:hypothetical protein